MKAVYTKRKKFKCSMFTIVFKTAALREKFPGGVRKFGKTHYIRHNRDIAVLCDMGSSIDGIIKKMNKNGLVYLEDYFVFDASGHLGIPWIKDHQTVEFQVDWLRGFTRDAGTVVSYADGPQEETALPPEVGARRERLRARVIF